MGKPEKWKSLFVSNSKVLNGVCSGPPRTKIWTKIWKDSKRFNVSAWHIRTEGKRELYANTAAIQAFTYHRDVVPLTQEGFAFHRNLAKFFYSTPFNGCIFGFALRTSRLTKRYWVVRYLGVIFPIQEWRLSRLSTSGNRSTIQTPVRYNVNNRLYSIMMFVQWYEYMTYENELSIYKSV